MPTRRDAVLTQVRSSRDANVQFAQLAHIPGWNAGPASQPHRARSMSDSFAVLKEFVRFRHDDFASLRALAGWDSLLRAMDIIDLWWNASQQSELRNLRESLHATRVTARSKLETQARMIQLLEEEGDELRLRLGVLIRLLVEKGLITASDFAGAIQQAKTSLIPPAPSISPKHPKPRKLPKPPKLNVSKPKHSP